MIDPGPEVETHLRALVRQVSGARSVRVLVTHGHADHAALASALARRLGVEVLGPGPDFDAPLSNGQVLHTDQGELVAVSTPGHARHHMVFHWPAASAVFLGDLVLGQGDTTWVGEYPGCVADYLDSLERVRALGADRGYPAHGPPLDELAGALDRYEAHRRDRIRQVERALGAEPEADARTLLGRIYGPVPAAVEAAALASVEVIVQHLRPPA